MNKAYFFMHLIFAYLYAIFVWGYQGANNIFLRD